MKVFFYRAAALVAVCGLAAPPTLSQQVLTAGVDSSSLMKLKSERTDVTFEGNSLHTLEDMAVHLKSGERLGYLDGVYGDRQEKVSAFAVEISHGFLGLGNYIVVIPAHRMTLDKQQNRLVTDLQKPQIDDLPRNAGD